MTPEQAESYAILVRAVTPLFTGHHAHAERVNEQSRKAARPMFWIAGLIVAAVAGAALWAVVIAGDAQLGRDLLLPLLSFAGGLGIGRSVNQVK